VFFNEFYQNERILTHARPKLLEYFMESAMDDKERFKIKKIIDQDKISLPIIPRNN